MSTTLHHRACHLCEAICGLTIQTEADAAGQVQIVSIKGRRRRQLQPWPYLPQGRGPAGYPE